MGKLCLDVAGEAQVGYQEQFLSGRVVRHWNRSGEVSIPACVEEEWKYSTLRDMVSGHAGDQLVVGLLDLGNIFQPL